ncbi:Pol polyprotein [Elysia marginata]|uniref:Pol polyprotein n=1 Tax=Elysia marginata TaxID=1093978 RepID=A0AAV4FVI5_9GAST|nr:Pol polyprotein [Elysia marginata]
MFERNIRNTLPCLSKNLKHNCMNRETLESKDRKAKQRQKINYDKHQGVINLPELQPGDPVLVKTDDEKHWKTQARVLQKVAPRSYIVRTDLKGDLRRNRRHLKKIPESNYRHMDQDDNLDLEPDQEFPPAAPVGLWTSSVAGTPL